MYGATSQDTQTNTNGSLLRNAARTHAHRRAAPLTVTVLTPLCGKRSERRKGHERAWVRGCVAVSRSRIGTPDLDPRSPLVVFSHLPLWRLTGLGKWGASLERGQLELLSLYVRTCG
jgi:hypothetical protein